MVKQKLAKVQTVLNNLREVIDDIKNGNIRNEEYNQLMIDLALHHKLIPGGQHIEDFFTTTFSTLAYFLVNFKSPHSKEVAAAQAMLKELGDCASDLTSALRGQLLNSKLYVPRSQEYSINIHDIWNKKFGLLVAFFEQFTDLKHDCTLDAYKSDMQPKFDS